MAVCWVQTEIAVLPTALVRDRKYLVWRLKHKNNRVFSGFFKKLAEEGRQVKVNVYKELQEAVDVYRKGWQARLNVFREAVADIVLPENAV